MWKKNVLKSPILERSLAIITSGIFVVVSCCRNNGAHGTHISDGAQRSDRRGSELIFLARHVLGQAARHNDHVFGNLRHFFDTQVHHATQCRLQVKWLDIKTSVRCWPCYPFRNIFFTNTARSHSWRLRNSRPRSETQLWQEIWKITDVFALEEFGHSEERFCGLSRTDVLSLKTKRRYFTSPPTCNHVTVLNCAMKVCFEK